MQIKTNDQLIKVQCNFIVSKGWLGLQLGVEHK